MAIQKVKCTIKGVAPLLMHCGRLADPFYEYTQELKKATDANKGRNKTEDGTLRVAELEYQGGLYFDDKLGPVIPADNLVAMTIEGAPRGSGVLFKAAVYSEEDAFKLDYDGPRTRAALWKDARFRDYRNATIGQSKVMRMRPKFKQWGCSFALNVNTDIVDIDLVEGAIAKAGLVKGIGDWTPRHGRFEVVEFAKMN